MRRLKGAGVACPHFYWEISRGRECWAMNSRKSIVTVDRAVVLGCSAGVGG